jgi:hypothetical protein
VLVVMEAVHPSAREDVDALASALAAAVESTWGVRATRGQVSKQLPVFAFS